MDLSTNEQIILAILVEGPQHGYGIEQIINERGMRKWTELGFSSIYYLLEKLEQKGLANSSPSRGKEKKEYEISPLGLDILKAASQEQISQRKPSNTQLMTGLASSFLLDDTEWQEALLNRKKQVQADLDEMLQREKESPHDIPVVHRLFSLGKTMLEAELTWLEKELSDL